MPIRTLIVDDEPLARRRLRAFLRPEADMEIVGECGNGDDAVAAIRKIRPDLVFLDIQMPGKDGFAVLAELDPRHLPLIIFVTAHDQYAVQAFEQRALDYLLKPFGRKRFQDAVSRARDRLAGPESGDFRERITGLLRTVAGPKTHLVVRTGGHAVLLQTARIEWLEAEGDYVLIHAGREAYLTRQTMNRISAELGSGRFVRIHRSTIVNVEFIREIHPLPGGDHVITLRDLTQVTLSRGYRDRLEHALGQKL
ncbi:MAG TPA: LytTR family DNA-binding domain-containing protein [Candidatus Acidoferrales bacterium]|nr:LytTR family DNA-binding domain-containing protein [Candidatus Acidoferrales bacterium]